jgi:hypothetical protein
MHNTGQTGGLADADIDAPEAWVLTTGSRSVRVAIIDSGIDYNHPDLTDQLAYFSNYGLTSVDLGAPGVTIYRMALNSAHQNLSGTSMATPHVAGAAALLKVYRPSPTGTDIKTALMASVDLVPALAGKTVTGARLIVYSALLALDKMIVSPATGWSVDSRLDETVPTQNPTYFLRNLTGVSSAWTATVDVLWLELNITSGSTPASGSSSICIGLAQAAAEGLPAGIYQGHLGIIDLVNGIVYVRPITLNRTVIAYSFDLSSNPSWARTGEWAFGQPTGQGGGQYGGHPDPTSGYTGPNVFGVNLAGNYSLCTGGPYALTAGPFNLTGYIATRLKFTRWLNTDFEPYISAAVEVSTSGSTWQTVQSNGVNLITDSEWSLQ